MLLLVFALMIFGFVVCICLRDMGVFGYFGMWELEQNTMGMKVNHNIPYRKRNQS